MWPTSMATVVDQHPVRATFARFRRPERRSVPPRQRRCADSLAHSVSASQRTVSVRGIFTRPRERPRTNTPARCRSLRSLPGRVSAASQLSCELHEGGSVAAYQWGAIPRANCRTRGWSVRLTRHDGQDRRRSPRYLPPAGSGRPSRRWRGQHGGGDDRGGHRSCPDRRGSSSARPGKGSDVAPFGTKGCLSIARRSPHCLQPKQRQVFLSGWGVSREVCLPGPSRPTASRRRRS
jgi:hypothetical protein